MGTPEFCGKDLRDVTEECTERKKGFRTIRYAEDWWDDTCPGRRVVAGAGLCHARFCLSCI